MKEPPFVWPLDYFAFLYPYNLSSPSAFCFSSTIEIDKRKTEETGETYVCINGYMLYLCTYIHMYIQLLATIVCVYLLHH